MKKQQLIFLAVFSILLISQNSWAQIVEIESRTDGFLPPVMTTAERDAIVNPRDGLIIYREDVGRLNYYEAGRGWAELYKGSPIEYFLSLPNGIQVLLDAGETPANLILAGANLADFIGLNHAGGIIFYMDPIFHGTGLVAAPTDAPTSLAWGNSGGFGAGCNGVATGAILAGIGDGVTNTMTVLNDGCDLTGSAFEYVNNLNLSNYNDWFLPSKDELYLMYKNLNRNGCTAAPPGSTDNSTCTTSLGNFAVSFYWSSSEFDGVVALRQGFVDGLQDSSVKYNNFDHVRAIRAF